MAMQYELGLGKVRMCGMQRRLTSGRQAAAAAPAGTDIVAAECVLLAPGPPAPVKKILKAARNTDGMLPQQQPEQSMSAAQAEA